MVSENGANNSGHAGQLDLLLARNVNGGNWNPPKEMASGSDDPIEYLARTEISEEEIARTTRIFIFESRRTFGYSDMPGAIRWKYNARMSLGRKRVNEIVKMVSGNGGMLDALRGGRGMFGGKTIDKQDVTPRP